MMIVINDCVCVLRIEHDFRKGELDSWQERSIEEVEDITKPNGHHITTHKSFFRVSTFVCLGLKEGDARSGVQTYNNERGWKGGGKEGRPIGSVFQERIKAYNSHTTIQLFKKGKLNIQTCVCVCIDDISSYVGEA